MKSNTTVLRSIGAWFLMLFLFSCSNDTQEVMSLIEDQELPMEVSENLILTFSDSALTRLQLEAPLAEYYPTLDDPERRFPKGIDVKFFDSFGREESRLTADRAIQFIDKDLWQANGNVVFINKKGEQLNTEELFWNQKTELIYSDQFVRLSTDTEVIMGEGFEATQEFDSYRINKVTGQIDFSDEEDVENR